MDLKGAEIFSVGTWNGLEFTTEDLQAIAASFTELALAGRVPLKFGHNDEQPVTDGQPALGWVERVWTEGGKLLADFANMPTVVFDAIKAQLYKFVSVELWQDAERDGSSYPWVLSAVALLGADEPAVGNLKDLAALTMRSTGLRWKASRTFATAEIPHSKRGARKTMEIDEKELSQLRAEFAKAQADVAAVTAANTKLIENGKPTHLFCATAEGPGLDLKDATRTWNTVIPLAPS